MPRSEESQPADSPQQPRRDLKGALLLTSTLRGRMLEMIDTGAILPPESDSLKSKADAALQSLASGHPDQTTEWLGEFVEIAHAVIQEGGLSAEQGLPLIEEARAVIRRLGE